MFISPASHSRRCSFGAFFCIFCIFESKRNPSPLCSLARVLSRKAYGFYDDINKVLDFYIDLVPAETKKAAEKLLPEKRAALPKFLFREKSALMREKVAIS